MAKKWGLSGKRKRVRLNKHMITIIDSPPIGKIMPLEEGQKKLRQILLEAE